MLDKKIFVLSDNPQLELRRISFFSGGVSENYLKGGKLVPEECDLLVVHIDNLNKYLEQIKAFLAAGKSNWLVLMAERDDMIVQYQIRKALPCESRPCHRVKVVEHSYSGVKNFSAFTLKDVVESFPGKK